jgi:hypothetical protein
MCTLLEVRREVIMGVLWACPNYHMDACTMTLLSDGAEVYHSIAGSAQPHTPAFVMPDALIEEL